MQIVEPKMGLYVSILQMIQTKQRLNLAWPNSRPGQRFIKKYFTGPDNLMLVAEAQGEMVGYACGGKVSTSLAWKRYRRFLLANVFITEAYRGSGIGTALTTTFIDWAKDRGAEKIKINAFTKNKSAIGLYKKLGFKDSTTSLIMDV